jgi:integrase
MIEDMQLHGFAERTQEAYLLAVRQLAKHCRKSPDQIEEEELRQYFLFLKNEKHAARATCTIALCGIKFFYERTLGREWKVFEFLRPPKEKKLPVVLSVSEVRRVLACIHRQPYQVCLTTIYTCTHRRCGVPVGCVCWKASACRSKISMENANSFTCVREKEARIAMYPCQKPACSSCDYTG